MKIRTRGWDGPDARPPGLWRAPWQLGRWMGAGWAMAGGAWGDEAGRSAASAPDPVLTAAPALGVEEQVIGYGLLALTALLLTVLLVVAMVLLRTMRRRFGPAGEELHGHVGRAGAGRGDGPGRADAGPAAKRRGDPRAMVRRWVERGRGGG